MAAAQQAVAESEARLHRARLAVLDAEDRIAADRIEADRIEADRIAADRIAADRQRQAKRY